MLYMIKLSSYRVYIYIHQDLSCIVHLHALRKCKKN